MPAWLRRIGFILSTSDDESFHMAPAEGMASRAVPVIRHWPGAETIYDKRWIRETPAEMAASIAALSSAQALGGRAADGAYEQVQAFDLGTVAEAWLRLIRGDAARHRRPRYQLRGARAVPAAADRMFFTLAVSAADACGVRGADRAGAGRRSLGPADSRSRRRRLAVP